MKAGLGPQYRRLWTVAAISNLGDGVTLAAMPLLAASLTRDPSGVATIVLAIVIVPWVNNRSVVEARAAAG